MSLAASILIGILIVALSFAGLLLLLFSLFHLRYDVAWFGMWAGGASLPHEKSAQLELGFPGFMWKWSGGAPPKVEPEYAGDVGAPPQTPDANPHSETVLSSNFVKATPGANFGGGVGEPVVAAREPETPAFAARQPQVERSAHFTPKDPNRFRKALFRFVTDGPVWTILLGYVIGMLMRATRLLHARLEFSAGHPDPAFLGRMAGRWYAVSAALPKDRVVMNFRFQDQNPTFGVRVVGGFSLLACLWFLAAALFTFPLFRLGWRAWQGWKLRHLTGWRAWTYRKIQSI